MIVKPLLVNLITLTCREARRHEGCVLRNEAQMTAVGDFASLEGAPVNISCSFHVACRCSQEPLGLAAASISRSAVWVSADNMVGASAIWEIPPGGGSTVDIAGRVVSERGLKDWRSEDGFK